MRKAKITTGKRPQLIAKEAPVASQKPTKERKKKNV